MDVTDLVFIDATGYHFSDFPTFLSWLQGQYRGIYGQDVYLGNDSQDGQFVSTVAQALYDTAALGSSTYNSFSPSTAQGVGLSRNVKINGLAREKPTFSTVQLTIVGTANTIITNGIAADILGQQWALPASVTIPTGGSITVTGTATVIGNLSADIGTVTTVFTPTRGWQTVNNATAAIPGAPVESDAELRVRQSVSTGIPAETVFEATLGAIANLPGVTDYQGYENYTDSTDGNGLPPHSICFVVTGGADQDICNAILLKKTPGTNPFGNVTLLCYDARGLPIYISFQRSVPAQIGVQVTLTKGAGWTDDYVPEIQNALANIINTNGIGNKIRYTTLYAPGYLNGTTEGAAPANAYIIDTILINYDGGSFFAADIELAFDEQPVCGPTTDVTVIAT